MNTISEAISPQHLSKKDTRSQHHQHQQFQYQYQYQNNLGRSTPPFSKVNYNNPYIHTFNSEWIDTPDNSPSRYSKFYDHNTNINMSSTTTTKLETPSKLKNSGALSFNYVTPVSETKNHDVVTINEKPLSRNSSPNETEEEDTSAMVNSKKHQVKNFDIFWAMLNNITGKDKMAKLGQYSLRLLLNYASKTENYLSNDSINIEVINKRYNDNEKKLNLIKNFIKHPSDFIRIIIILVVSIFQSKFSGLAKGLGTYRQFLRFGKSPFRIRQLYNNFLDNYDVKSKQINPGFFNKDVLGDLIGLYYNMNDEATLLFKLNVLSNKSLKSFVSRHESLAWYYDSWLALFNAFNKLQDYSKQEMDIKIQIQVKKRAKILSKQLLGGTAIRTIDLQNSNSSLIEDSKDEIKLKEIQFNKQNSYLDIYKNISDIIFNSYTVFNIKLPFDTLQIWMGISASGLSTIKLYREIKKKLIEESITKKS